MRKIALSLIILFAWAFGSPAQAVIAITAAGVQATSGGTTVVVTTLSTGAASIPANSIILVAVTDPSTSGSLSAVTDNASNSYTLAASKALNGSASNGIVYLYWSYTGNALNLTSSGTLTYTKNANGAKATVSVSYLSGAQTGSGALDASVTQTASGTTGTITATSGALSVANEMLIGVFGNSNNNTFTQDTTNGWSSPPNGIGTGGGGGSQVDGGHQTASGAKTFAPTVATSNGNWALLIVGFEPPNSASSPFIFTPAVIP